jgi:hypothetical protein
LSRCLATIGGMQLKTHRLMLGIYEVRRRDGLRCHGIRTRFNKDWFRQSKVNGGGGLSDTQTGWRWHKPTSIFSQNKESRLKTIIILFLLFIITANGFSLGGSRTTIRHNTQITHNEQTKHNTQIYTHNTHPAQN